LDENTVIIYTSDNGYFWGEHRLKGKEAPYEDAIRIPLVIRPAGGTSPRQENNLVLNIDLAPTIVALAGLTPTIVPNGRSLVPFLTGTTPDPPWRDKFVIEHWEDRDGMTTFAGVKSATEKYVEYINGEKEYYRADDPDEINNQAANPLYEDDVTRLEADLDALLDFDWPPPPQTTTGLIFASSFEYGDFSAWSTSTAGSQFLVAPEAALGPGDLETSRGLKVVVVSGADVLQVQDDAPNHEPHYRARFHFDPNGFHPGPEDVPSEVVLFFAGADGANPRLVSIVLQWDGVSVYSLVARDREDDDGNQETSEVIEFGPFGISDAPHSVEFEWIKASGAEANGSFKIWIDAANPRVQAPRAVRTDLDTHDRGVDFARLGAISLKNGALGVLYFDRFMSRRDAP
jgi:hypothetical protein